MNDRLKFRATFPVSYYDENGNDKDIKLTIYDVAVYSGGEIGFSAQQIETIINALELPEVEQDTMWQFINDNYATSSYEWFVCDNAIIEQCTGLKDKNGNLIYEGDILLCDRKIVDCGTGEEIHYKKSGVVQRDKNGQYFINGKDWYGSDITFYNECAEIIGNIHEQPEQNDK